MMKRVRIYTYGGPEVLQLETVTMPEPGMGQALVRVACAGVNFSDTAMRRAPYPPLSTGLPVDMGSEGAGTVEAIGPDVTMLQVGTRVAWAGVSGSYATHVLAPIHLLFPIPDQVSSEQAASLLVQGSVAHILSHAVYPLRQGASCLIQSIAGGLGLLLCQMAKAAGALVIGTTSTYEKARIAYEAEADHVIVYKQADFEAEVKRITQGRGVNVIYDTVGRDTFDKGLNCLATRGTFVLFGATSGQVPPIDVMRLAKGSFFLTRVVAMHYMTPEVQFGRVQELFRWVSEGRLRSVIGQSYALADAARAHKVLEEGQSIGKVLLYP